MNTAIDKMVPVTVLTGFLGAGKTTLLKRILSEFHGRRIAVIENEFGPENIDNELLVQDSEEEIIELSNGCICCTVRGDLLRTLNDLRIKREQGELNFERVIIETTGMANPGPVCQTFFMDDDIAAYYRLDAVITVVDAKHGMDTLDKQDESQKQIGFADKILISKKDLVSDDDYHVLRQRIIRINPRAAISNVHFGETELSEILDVSGFNLNAVLDIDPEFLAAEDHKHDHDHDHDCDDHCDHDHDHHHKPHQDSVSAFVFTSRRPFDPERLEDFLGGITQVFGPDLLRYKGILYIKGANRRMVFQGVHMMMGAEPGRPWLGKEKPETKLVFIGHKLPKEVFMQGLEQCLV